MPNALLVGLALILGQPNPAQTAAQQEAPELAILRRAAASIKTVHTDWYFDARSSGQPPLMSQQLGAAVGVWMTSGGDGPPSIQISAEIYSMATPEAASRFFEDGLERRVFDGWTLESYALGDAADIATYGASEQFEISFQRGRFLVFVHGTSREVVESVARYVLTAVDG